MKVRGLFAMLVALAVLFAPAFSRAGEASAAAPNHHAQMSQAEHCQMPGPGTGDPDKAPAKSCCASLCVGVAITGATPLVAAVARSAPARATLAQFHVNGPAELATPPPKLS